MGLPRFAKPVGRAWIVGSLPAFAVCAGLLTSCSHSSIPQGTLKTTDPVVIPPATAPGADTDLVAAKRVAQAWATAEHTRRVGETPQQWAAGLRPLETPAFVSSLPARQTAAWPGGKAASCGATVGTLLVRQPSGKPRTIGSVELVVTTELTDSCSLARVTKVDHLQLFRVPPHAWHVGADSATAPPAQPSAP